VGISLGQRLGEAFDETDGTMVVNNALENCAVGGRERSRVVGIHRRSLIEHGRF